MGFIRLSFGFKILPAVSIFLATSQIDDALVYMIKPLRYGSVVFVRKVQFERDRAMRETTGLSPKTDKIAA